MKFYKRLLKRLWISEVVFHIVKTPLFSPDLAGWEIPYWMEKAAYILDALNRLTRSIQESNDVLQ